MVITLGYWDLRALGFLPRLLLDLSGQEWKFEQHKLAESKKWFTETKKENGMGLPVPNLPYLIDGDLRMTQRDAICMYIIEKYIPHLMPEDIGARAVGRMWQGIVGDMMKQVLGIVIYDKLTDDERKTKFTAWVENFDRVFGASLDKQIQQHKFFLSDSLSFFDLVILDVLELLEVLDSRLATEPRKAFITRIKSEPTIAKHYASDNYEGNFFYKSPLA